MKNQLHEQRAQTQVDLNALAWQVMGEKRLRPDFSPAATQQAELLSAAAGDSTARDLRALDWLSIDNEDSQDLDQLTVAEALNDGGVRVQVAIADVDALVAMDSLIDQDALYNSTSVYAVAQTFPMLPGRLSYDLTSLLPGAERQAIVVSFVVTKEGAVESPDVFAARVCNRARLTYKGVADWLQERPDASTALQRTPGLSRQVRLQEETARRLRARRQERGTLELQTVQFRAVMRNGKITDLRAEPQNRAEQLIEDLMIATNSVTAQFLTERGFPTMRRVVHTPRHWDDIVRLAAEHGCSLPPAPDSRALSAFLHAQQQADPLRFPGLSLLVVKLIGPGEYTVHVPGSPPVGHFGMAVQDYAHATAPNRRYPDLITQRLLKAALRDDLPPYSGRELAEMGAHCTFKQDMADRVERQMQRSVAALLLSKRVGEWFKGVITAVTPKGVYVRVLHPPVEGMIGSRRRSVVIGEPVSVRLAGTDVERGYLDFVL